MTTRVSLVQEIGQGNRTRVENSKVSKRCVVVVAHRQPMEIDLVETFWSKVAAYVDRSTMEKTFK